MSRTIKMAIFLPIAAICVAALIVGNMVLSYFSTMITEFFSGRVYDFSRLDMHAGDTLAQEIEAEGIVLLKNELSGQKPTLPLTVASMPVKENETEMLAAWQKTPVVVMGWGATDAGFVMGGSGSGSSTERGGGMMKPFLQGMSEGGFEVYTPIVDMMKNYTDERGGESLQGVWPFFFLYEPAVETYQAHMAGATAHSDTAIVVISRLGGEGADIPFIQRQWTGSGARSSSWSGQMVDEYGYTYSGTGISNGTADPSRTYLDISVREQEVLDLAIENFEKVIVVVNAANAMNLSFLEESGVDAAISVGLAGQSGSLAIADVLRGKKTVREVVKVTNPETGEEEDLVEKDAQGNPVIDPDSNQTVKVYKRSEYAFSPSGRTVDTYVRDFTADPTYVNAGKNGVTAYTNGGNYVDYVENIYVGYYYYETAHRLSEEDKYEDFKYNDVVQYPFGYGKSYTKFQWTIDEILPERGETLKKDDEIKIRLTVKNIGDYPGKDVIQVYFTAPYKDGGIEKPYVKLCAYAKTELLDIDGEQRIEVSFRVSDMASYDCYDLNQNGFRGYELEAGTNYEIKLQTDAHTLAETEGGSAVISYKIGDYRYDSDTVIETPILDEDGQPTEKNISKTLKYARNRFTGDVAYSGVSIDGKNSDAEIEYMTRKNFKATFPTAKAASRAKADKDAFQDGYGKNEVLQGAVTPKEGVDANLRLYKETDTTAKWDISKPNHELMMRLGADYNDPLWDAFLDQIPATGNVSGDPGTGSGGSLETLIGRGGWRTSHVDAIGKPWNVDLDGPSGLNSNVTQSKFGQSTLWSGFPVSTVLAQSWNDNLSYMFGLAVAAEAKATGVSGWYAPAMNMHRSPFMGRNFEYYSEDPFLSGRMGAESTRGALTNGMYAYLKHFAGNDCETSRKGLYTWMTEQALREVYLRPFEIAVKEGDANAVMSAFNRVGPVWAGGNKALLEGILREEWGFTGSVITDYYGGGDGGYMNVDQGIRSGGDLWLSGEQQMPNSAGFGDKDSPTARVQMRRAAKNILFTLTNSYYYSNVTEGEVLQQTPPAPLGFPWWIIWGWVPVNIVLVAGLLICIYFAFPQIGQALFKNKKAKKSGGEPAAQG